MNVPSKSVPHEPQVVYEDNHIIVLDKPPRLATMGVAEDEPSLLKWTKGWIKEKYEKPGNVFLGVVSRLDSFTTGLIMFARTSKAASRLTRQFQSGEVRKVYTAILEQAPLDQEGQLVDWVVKNDDRRRMQVVRNMMEHDPQNDSPQTNDQARFTTRQSKPKRAELRYRVVGTFGEQALVKVELVTGRKHQIRIQFASRGCPVLGDSKYDAREKFHAGIALQCSELEFMHPVRREELSFRIEPPKRWNLQRFRPI